MLVYCVLNRGLSKLRNGYVLFRGIYRTYKFACTYNMYLVRMRNLKFGIFSYYSTETVEKPSRKPGSRYYRPFSFGETPAEEERSGSQHP